MLKGRFDLNFEQIYLEAKNDKVEERLEDELSSFSDLLQHSYDFKLFLEDPRISADYKKKCLKQLCPEGLTHNFFSLINMLIDRGREEMVHDLAKNFTKLLAGDKHIIFGQVTIVRPLPENLRQRLKQSMETWKSSPVRLRYTLDPELLGGLSVRFIDGMVLDASLKHKLNDLKQAILG